MPRAAASTGLMKTRCGNASSSQSTPSIVECTRASVWWPTTWSGNRFASGPNGLSHSWMYFGTAGISAGRPSACRAAEKISILPDGVGSGMRRRVLPEVGERDRGFRHGFENTPALLASNSARAGRSGNVPAEGR